MSALVFDTSLLFAHPHTLWEDSAILTVLICIGIPILPTISPDMFETNKIKSLLLKPEKQERGFHKMSVTFLCTMPKKKKKKKDSCEVSGRRPSNVDHTNQRLQHC